MTLLRVPSKPSQGERPESLTASRSANIRLVLSSLSTGEGSECRSVNADALAEARRLGVSVPRLEAREVLFNGVGRQA